MSNDLSLLFFAIGAVVSVAIALGMLLLARQRELKALGVRLKQLESVQQGSRSDETPPEPAPAAEEPEPELAAATVPPSHRSEIPAELIELCSRGNCVLFAGNGLAVMAGYPPWTEALEHFLANTHLEQGERTSLVKALRRGTSAVMEALLARPGRSDLIFTITKLYGGSPPQPLPPVLDHLEHLPFSAILTTHWHSLLDYAFADRNPTVLSPSKGDIDAALRPGAFPIVKLYGDLKDVASLILTPGEYRRALEDDNLLARFLTSLALTRSHLFLGTSVGVLEDYFSNLQLRSVPEVSHFAVVPETEWSELDRQRLLAKYGIHLIVQPGISWKEVEDFARVLREAVNHRQSEPRTPIQPSFIVRVRLTNIGPYRNLSLDLHQGWNILLGNNGVGKSTLLRAIALGLCGDDVRASVAARRLLRAGAPRGSVEVQVGQETYRTELIREPDEVRVVCRQLTPLRTGNWVVLGFPPLRGISLRNPSGPSEEGPSRPVIGDLLPVLLGDTDERFDNLKQWIVNLDVRSTPGVGISETEAQRNQQLRGSFFGLLKAFMPGMEIDFKEVDRRSWEVRVQTVDGIVPIEQISMGMSSLFGWLGTLLRRMYDVYPDAERPEQEPALVIIDEIDAHLHPEWQQMLAPALKEHFPNLQVVGTTHSPLVVAGMERDEVLIAYRVEDDPQAIEIEKPPLDFEGMRADQILTSPLFGLATTRSHGVRNDIDRYSELLGKAERSVDEEAELLVLRGRLSPILMVGETVVERNVEKAVQVALDEMSPATMLSRVDPKVQLEVKRQLAELLGQGEE